MKKIEDCKYFVAFFDEPLQLFDYKWKPENREMTEEDYTRTMTQIISLITQYKSSRVLVDMRLSQFVITPVLQEWNAINVFQFGYERGMRLVAFIVSNDIIQQLSVEQMSEEAQNHLKQLSLVELQVQFFSDKVSAHQWLTSKQV